MLAGVVSKRSTGSEGLRCRESSRAEEAPNGYEALDEAGYRTSLDISSPICKVRGLSCASSKVPSALTPHATITKLKWRRGSEDKLPGAT